ncbi:MAG: hypothetical protein Q4D41_11955 [Prevotellaceae bacterium]|nr:hypothetical protein [Prevotellaceae bacterium]
MSYNSGHQRWPTCEANITAGLRPADTHYLISPQVFDQTVT